MKKILMSLVLCVVFSMCFGQIDVNYNDLCKSTKVMSKTDTALFNLSVDIADAGQLMEKGFTHMSVGGALGIIGAGVIGIGASTVRKSAATGKGVMVVGGIVGFVGLVFAFEGLAQCSKGSRILKKCTINTEGIVVHF